MHPNSRFAARSFPARSLVDQRSHAKAYEELGGPGVDILPDLIRQLGFNFFLDIGCGSGTLLLDLAEGDSNFIGCGIDISPASRDS
jgi:SAM-dependent methyltransferase